MQDGINKGLILSNNNDLYDNISIGSNNSFANYSNDGQEEEEEEEEEAVNLIIDNAYESTCV